MPKYFTTALLLLVSFWVHAQPLIYDASTVPEKLKKNASSVKREERISFEVRSADKAVCKFHQLVTVLNEGGKDELDFVKYTDQFHSLGDVEISVYDSKGTLQHKYTRSDLAKLAVGELVPESKVYYMTIPVPEYPATIETDYEIRYNGILNYPDYNVQLPEQAVENSVFTARVPADIDLRYKQQNCHISPAIGEDGKYKTYTWEVKDLPALQYEEGSVSRESRYPRILLAPNKFELDGYAGDMSTWQQFGQWYNKLVKNVMNLSDDRKLFFQAMVKDATDDKEKIRRIYNYLQNNFRYVSIQLGIGGYRPFEADFVDKKKYGDCKALSNYTQACLNAVGIKSYLALINAEYNKQPVDPDFPHNSFNHMILCVPMAKDSIWLECTSTSNDFGVLGSFTENRNALLITEDGGKLVATPRSMASENTYSSNAVVTLNEDGSGSAKLLLSNTGEYRQEFIAYAADQVKDEQKKYLINGLGFQQPDRFDISYDKTNKQAVASVSMEIEKIPEFASGNKFFLNPRIYKLWRSDLPKAENRTQDYYFAFPFIKTDTTVYKIPEGFAPETLPRPRDLKFEFGSFSSSCRFDEQQRAIITTARLVLTEYKIPVAKFPATKKFFNDVLAEYTEKIVIKHL